MGHDHQLAGIKLLWLAGLNKGWRMPLSHCIQCVQIGLKPFQKPYMYIYIYIYAKAVKATWERIKAYRVHIYFHWVEQLIGNNQWLKILISELEYVDLWITCVLIHCLQVDPIVLDDAALRCLLAYQDQECQCWGSWPWMRSLGWNTLVPRI